MRTYMVIMLFALGTTVLLTPVVRRLALAFNVLAPLRDRDVHVVPTPRMGGVAMTLGLGMALGLGSQMHFLAPIYQGNIIWVVLGGAILISLLGAADDAWELDWTAKLGGQLIITGWMALSGVQLISFPVFGLTIGSARLSVVISVLVMVTVINAVNFIDGLDGLAAGVIAIGAGSFFVYSYLLSVLMGASSYATASAVIMVSLMGVCVGFLWFNFHPASIFMGDSGSMMIGLVMSAAAIIVTGQINPNVLGDQAAAASVLPILLPLVVVAIPLVDLVWTAVGRMLQGKSPFVADRTHLHDRLLRMGHSHRGVVVILYLWTLLAGGIGIALLLYPPIRVVAAGLGIAGVLALVSIFVLPGMRGGRPAPGGGVPGGPVIVDDGIEVISRTRRPLRQTIRRGLEWDPVGPQDKPKWRQLEVQDQLGDVFAEEQSTSEKGEGSP